MVFAMERSRSSGIPSIAKAAPAKRASIVLSGGLKPLLLVEKVQRWKSSEELRSLAELRRDHDLVMADVAGMAPKFRITANTLEDAMAELDRQHDLLLGKLARSHAAETTPLRITATAAPDSPAPWTPDIDANVDVSDLVFGNYDQQTPTPASRRKRAHSSIVVEPLTPPPTPDVDDVSQRFAYLATPASPTTSFHPEAEAVAIAETEGAASAGDLDRAGHPVES